MERVPVCVGDAVITRASRSLRHPLDEITEQKFTLLSKRLADMRSSIVNLVVKTFQTMLRRAYRATVPEVEFLPEQWQRNWYTPEDYEHLVAAAIFDVVSLVIVLLGGDASQRAGRYARAALGGPRLHQQDPLRAPQPRDRPGAGNEVGYGPRHPPLEVEFGSSPLKLHR